MKDDINKSADISSKKLQAWAKNPPYPKSSKWTDKTGDARESISGGYLWIGDKCRTYVSGDVSYFVYLEMHMEKRFAVLFPAILALEVEILNRYKGVI